MHLKGGEGSRWQPLSPFRPALARLPSGHSILLPLPLQLLQLLLLLPQLLLTLLPFPLHIPFPLLTVPLLTLPLLILPFSMLPLLPLQLPLPLPLLPLSLPLLLPLLALTLLTPKPP